MIEGGSAANCSSAFATAVQARSIHAESSRTAPARSPLSQREHSGANNEGDLSRADVAGLQIWLTKHSDVARNIASQCKEAMKADTVWKNSAEGRICIAEKDAGYSN